MITKVLPNRCFWKMHSASPDPATSMNILRHSKCFSSFAIMVEVLWVNQWQSPIHSDLLWFHLNCLDPVLGYTHDQFYTFEEKTLQMSLHHEKTMKKWICTNNAVKHTYSLDIRWCQRQSPSTEISISYKIPNGFQNFNQP